MYRYSLILLILLLTGCGTTGNLYLPPDYIVKHSTPTQKIAPSTRLAALPKG